MCFGVTQFWKLVVKFTLFGQRTPDIYTTGFARQANNADMLYIVKQKLCPAPFCINEIVTADAVMNASV